MYNCVKLNLYCENWDSNAKDIKNFIVATGLPFKELHNSTLLFSAIKNPENTIVVLVSSKQLLTKLENFSKHCHNYQKRVFVVFINDSMNDNFFTNSCPYNNLSDLSKYLSFPLIDGLNNPVQPANLLVKLVQCELEKLQIPTKYIGFNYLTQLSVNYLCNNYSSNTYIELFKYVANINLASIDTIERDVRHMLLTTWKNSSIFRAILQGEVTIEKPNSKNILKAILAHLKTAI